MRAFAALGALAALAGCNQSSAADTAEDVAEATARQVAASSAQDAVDGRMTDVERRLRALERASDANLNTHVSMMDAVIASAKNDRAEVERLRKHYNEHLRDYHGARE